MNLFAALVLIPAAFLALGLGAERLLARRRDSALACASLRAALAAAFLAPAIFLAVSTLHWRTISLPLLGAASAAPAELALPEAVILETPAPTKSKALVPAPLPSTPARRAFPWSAVATLGWGAGCLFGAVRLGVAHFRVLGWRRRAWAASPEAQGKLRRLAAGRARRLPALRVSPDVSGPTLVGLFSPVILLPVFAPEPTEEVLLHELGHLRRCDLAWLLAGETAAAIWFFNPLAHGLARRQEECAEEACDAWVVAHTGRPDVYARQLLELAEVQAVRQERLQAGLPMVSLRSLLGQRVLRLIQSPQGRLGIGRRAAALLGLAALAGILAVGFVRPSRAAEEGTAKVPAAPVRRVRDIVVESSSLQPLDKQRVLDALFFSRGSVLYPEEIRWSLKALYATGNFDAVMIGHRPDGEGEVLTVIVMAKPSLKGVRFAGPALPDGWSPPSAIRAKEGIHYGELDALEDARSIEKAFEAGGTHGLKIVPKLKKDPDSGTAEVTFLAQTEEKK